MSIKNNTTSLQEVLAILSTKASATQATPEISVDASGLITATAGTKSSTHQLAFQAAKTITPSTDSQIAVSSGYYTGGDITVAGDENLVAENIKSGVSVFGVSGVLEDKDSTVKGLIGRTITEIRDDEVEAIGDYAFYVFSNLTSISFPACRTIGSEAFMNCDGLSMVSFPACSFVGNGAFRACNNLTTISFPACTYVDLNAFNGCSKIISASFQNCTYIGDHAFENCSDLTNLSFPSCTVIEDLAFQMCVNLTSATFPVCSSLGMNAFRGCTKLSIVSFPLCTSVGREAFGSCSNLKSVSLPLCANIEASVFYNCYRLPSIDLPSCSTVGSYAFAGCTALASVSLPVCLKIEEDVFSDCVNLRSIDLPVCSYIGFDAFSSCVRLSSICLRASSMCRLVSDTAFTGTPFKGNTIAFTGTPYIYVPASLVTSYKQNSVWHYFEKYFRTIENMGALLTFTIGGKSQTGEEMSWADWINSEYNVDNCYISDSTFYVQMGNNKIMYNGTEVKGTDLIINNAAYTLEALEDNAPE